MNLSKKELAVLENTDFLLTKGEALKKIRALLVLTRQELTKSLSTSSFRFPKGMELTKGKISRGENYQKLPYLVLDYPGLFTIESIFAFRVMFWWGHFFSATLHLQGLPLAQHRSSISENLDGLISRNVFIGVGDSPWHYHYEQDNYVPVNGSHRDLINNLSFIKLSRKLELKNWREVPSFSVDFLHYLLSVLKPDLTRSLSHSQNDG